MPSAARGPWHLPQRSFQLSGYHRVFLRPWLPDLLVSVVDCCGICLRPLGYAKRQKARSDGKANRSTRSVTIEPSRSGRVESPSRMAVVEIEQLREPVFHKHSCANPAVVVSVMRSIPVAGSVIGSPRVENMTRHNDMA